VPPKQKPTASAKPAPASKEHWRDHTSYKVDIGSIDVGDRIIAPTQKRIGDMIKSLEKAGQIHPILITKGKGDRWKLVTGAARLAAAKKLGWHQIKANTVDVDNPLDLQLLEIEENLGRHDLTDAVRKRLTAMEKKLRAGASEAARKAGIPERTGRRKAGAISGQNENGRKKPSERAKKCPMCHGTGRVKR
jgi:ParB-like chromosome segregation protein Spo0J